MTFADCKNAGSCGKDLCLPEFCHQFDPKQKSNADRIREMSDEELAMFLNKIVVCHHLKKEGYCPNCPIHGAKPCDTEGVLQWLKQFADKEV